METPTKAHLVWLPLLAYLCYLLFGLAGFDSLSSFANDSVHYLVMARHLSPWISETGAIATTWPLQDFPPFFPWLLALTGTAHSLFYAHLLVVALGLCSLGLFYAVSRKMLGIGSRALFPVLVFSLSPGFILGLQGILSESLYLLLVLAFMYHYAPDERLTRGKLLLVALLLTAILLTRTIGIALLLALLAQAFLSSVASRKIHYLPILVSVLSLIVYALLMAVWGPQKESHYIDVLLGHLAGDGSAGPGTVANMAAVYAAQLSDILDAWASFWIIYWLADGFTANYVIALVLLGISAAGLLLRLLDNRYDAWYVLIYLLILTLWPHPGQMFRLLYPVMPLLLIYAGYAINRLVRGYPSRTATLLMPGFFIVVLAAVLPAHAYLHLRTSIAANMHMIPVYEFFRHTDLAEAKNYLLIQNQMLDDFAKIRDTLPANAKVAYFLPEYPAILSDRMAVPSPSASEGNTLYQTVMQSGAGYILLTRLHPRHSLLKYDGLAGRQNLDSWTRQLWCSRLVDGSPVSCLYQVIHPAL